MNNYNNDFNHALSWANKYKMDDGPIGATALAGFLVLSLLNELDYKLEGKPQNYEGIERMCEQNLSKYEHSTNNIVVLMTVFLNVGLYAVHELHKKVNNKPNQSEELFEKINIWMNDEQNKEYHKSFKVVTNALSSFKEKIDLELEAKKPLNAQEVLRKKYRSIL